MPILKSRKYGSGKRGFGSIYLRGRTYWIKYYVGRERLYESSESSDENVAKKLLQQRLGQIAEGRLVSAERLTFDLLADGLLNDYRVNGKRTLEDVERRVAKHLAPFFRKLRVPDITTADVQKYITHRQQQKARNATINRELSALKRMFNLALKAGQLARSPYIPMLREDNTRKGFFEPWEFNAVYAKLPECLQGPIKFSYITGWRLRSEVLSLTWSQIDLDAGEVRLEPHTTKNAEARPFPFTQELRDLLDKQWQEHLTQYPDCPLVFHDHGRRIVNYRKRWVKACQEGKIPDRLPHDMRRTAIRNFNRLGITDKVAMTLAGHKTRSVFDRYAIVSKADLQEAARKLDSVSQLTLGTKTGTIASIESQNGELTH